MFISLAASENKERCRSNGGVLAVLQAQMVPMLPATQTTRDHTPPAPPSSHQTSHSAAEQSQGDIFVGKKKKKKLHLVTSSCAMSYFQELFFVFIKGIFLFFQEFFVYQSSYKKTKKKMCLKL